MEKTRIVCQFSCGAASAVATKLILAEYDPDLVVIVNAYIKEEHEDNRRFLKDCETWFGHPITVLKDEKYDASTHEIWRRKRYIIGHHKAPCSITLKRELLGFHNANCIGCPKGGAGYWNKIRQVFPEQFYQIADIQESIGPGAKFMRNRRTGERIYLRELDPTHGKIEEEPEISCSFNCELVEREIDIANED